jgi:Acyl-CoA reductase (LuxC)
VIPAFHLPPGVPAPPENLTWEVGTAGVRCAGPRVTPAWIEALAARLRQSGVELAARPVAEIAAAIGRVAERWLGGGDPDRREAERLLPQSTGYAPAAIHEALEHLFAGLRAAPLAELLRAELGDAAALDRFVPRRGADGADLGPTVRTRAIGPRLTVVWAAGNVPVAALPDMLHALLLKSPCVVKSAAEEPLLPALFARSLAREAPWLGDAVAVLHWPGEDAAVGQALLRHADAVIASGTDASLASLRAWVADGQRLAPSPLPPAGTRFQAHGHRVGFGVIGREALTAASLDDAAARAARDVALFDQQGCMSPQFFYVEEGGEQGAQALAGRIAAALAGWEERAPRRPLSAAEAAAIHQLRAVYEMRALARPDVLLLASSPGTAWTVIVDPDVSFASSCLNRTVLLCPVADAGQVPERVASLAGHLQTVVAALPELRLFELAERLAPLGVTRVAPLGRAQFPDPLARHDGYARLAGLVRWTDVEGG